MFRISKVYFTGTSEVVGSSESWPKEEKKRMGREPSKQDRSEGRKGKDQGWIKEAVGALT